MGFCDGLESDFLHIRLKTRLGRHCYSNPAPIVGATKSIWSPGHFAAVKPHILWQQCPEKSDPETSGDVSYDQSRSKAVFAYMAHIFVIWIAKLEVGNFSRQCTIFIHKVCRIENRIR